MLAALFVASFIRKGVGILFKTTSSLQPPRTGHWCFRPLLLLLLLQVPCTMPSTTTGAQAPGNYAAAATALTAPPALPPTACPAPAPGARPPYPYPTSTDAPWPTGGFPAMPWAVAEGAGEGDWSVRSATSAVFIGNGTGPMGAAFLRNASRLGVVGLGWQMQDRLPTDPAGAINPALLGRLEQHQAAAAAELKRLRPGVRVLASADMDCTAGFWAASKAAMANSSLAAEARASQFVRDAPPFEALRGVQFSCLEVEVWWRPVLRSDHVRTEAPNSPQRRPQLTLHDARFAAGLAAVPALAERHHLPRRLGSDGRAVVELLQPNGGRILDRARSDRRRHERPEP